MPRKTVEQRFWEKVDRQGNGDCWPWLGCLGTGGYAMFWNGERNMHAHRFAYELLVGPIPEGLVLDHLCRVRHCVNPAHLEPVTHAENIRRGEGWAGQHARKTHCPQGHPYDEENTIYRVRKSRWGRSTARECRICRRRRKQEDRQREKAKRRLSTPSGDKG